MASSDFKLRMRLVVDEVPVVGPGKIALLEALAREGSITAAAKALGMSYRRAWVLIDELNRALREPAVSTSQGGAKGGGSQLTETGEHLVALYRGIESKALLHCAADIKAMKKLLT